MPVLTENEFKKQLSSGQLMRVYVIYGEEKYLVRRAALQLTDKASGDGFPEFNRNEFSNLSSIDDIADAALALPFMAEQKCVAVSDYDLGEKTSQEENKLNELLNDLPEHAVLIFWYPTLEFDEKKAKWKNFLKAAAQKGGVLRCARREISDLKKLIIKEAEKGGCVLSPYNASLLTEYVGSDINSLFNEVEKLCAYAGGDGKEITAAMIEELVPKSTETTVFMMVNALVAGNYENAYRLMDMLFYRNEEPISILGALSSVYVDMYRVKAALQSGFSYTEPASYGDYRGMDFKLRNADKNARRLSEESLRRSLSFILEADLVLKGSRLSPRVIMDGLIGKLLFEAKGESL